MGMGNGKDRGENFIRRRMNPIQKYWNFLFILPLLLFIQLQASYQQPPEMSLEIWNQLKPYFLPIDHPIKPILDEIFQSATLITNRESLVAAGFKLKTAKQPGNLSVGKHPRLKGYLVKIYLENQDACEWDNFYKRVNGAEAIQACIRRHGYQQYFKVPKKWIYPLSFHSREQPFPDIFPKNFILVVEKMHLLSQHENGKAFKELITPDILDALYHIIDELGLFDSIFRGNIPFNKKGKICFIDTEHHHLWPVNFANLERYLSPEMCNYWQSLTNPMKENP